MPFREAVRAWFLISLQTFGGPAGQIAVMQRELVEQRRWIGQQRFLHALSYCTLLPGPEAQQLAIYVGWLLNGVRGGLAAGTLFVLPGVIALLGLSFLYVGLGETTVVSAVFTGLGAAVLAVVAQAVHRVGAKALHSPALVALAVAAFLALTVLRVPFPAVVAAAALIGWVLGRWSPRAVHAPPRASDPVRGPAPLVSDDAMHQATPSWTHAFWVLVLGAVAWGVPVGAVILLTGGRSVFTEQALFFSGAALVTFGGAYAVLAYVAQQAVEVHAWLTPGEMVRGLALAESTPGPLIMVVQFVAFVGAYRDPGTLDPWVAAVLASLLTTWVTFVPCFVFIFLGAPHVEGLRSNRALTAALTGITAAVVGVIAHLALFLALHTIFAATVDVRSGPVSLEIPVWESVRWIPLTITLLAGFLLLRLRWSVLRTLALCATLGLISGLTGMPMR
ncbi:chromate efflux transporter [Ornithinimicrobium tianjinense]|uniref:chromate efflux transporter n=1 Tax=Ornithinimicrobium tianjinense TaxID=1195761 RepID=UPI00366D74B1